MKNTIILILLIAISVALPSFILSTGPASPEQKIKDWYASNFKLLGNRLQELKTAVEQNKEEQIVHDRFLKARLAYKKLEFLLEYYAELDVIKFNGPPINFIEEEDPTADLEPQGFQVIESLIFPHYEDTNRQQALQYIDGLLQLTNGLSDNSAAFLPDQYVIDAVMEELYRIITLGITGFDSPVAQYSLPEANAALGSILFGLQAYEKELKANDEKKYTALMQYITRAQQYLDKHAGFNGFDRMEFITHFINPACTLLGHMGAQIHMVNNPARKYAVEKNGSLFDVNGIKQSAFLRENIVTREKIALGRKLFYEPLLSANGKRSCAGCHKPELGFTDGLTTALNIDEHSRLPRNTPTLWNACLQRNLFADSRQVSLDQLINEVLSNEKEMNSSAENSVQQIINDPGYKRLFQLAYPSTGTTIRRSDLVNAISMYLHTLISYNSRFDQYMRQDKSSMTAREIHGFNLFMGKARCGTCHFAPFFNGSKPPAYYYQESEVIGVPATTDTLHAVLDNDEGRYVSTKREFHKYAFKTPTLRNIALTAPYMHNGVYATLEEVMDFYNKGGGAGLGIAPENLTLMFDKLELTQQEINDIIAFLKTLTDTSALKSGRQ